MYATYRKRTYPIFGNVRYCVFEINSTPQCWCCLATDIRKKSRLNWKLKISNAADNADITQSHALDTRYRRMQEVNSLCMYSGLIRANTVLCHSTQYSLLVYHLVVQLFCNNNTQNTYKRDSKLQLNYLPMAVS